MCNTLYVRELQQPQTAAELFFTRQLRFEEALVLVRRYMHQNIPTPTPASAPALETAAAAAGSAAVSSSSPFLGPVTPMRSHTTPSPPSLLTATAITLLAPSSSPSPSAPLPLTQSPRNG